MLKQFKLGQLGMKASALTVALLAASTGVQAAGEAKNIIFFLGDGMGPTTVTASRIYGYGESGKLTMDTLRRTVRIKTYSEDGQTTDSAPSMAAYMTGEKTRNEVIGMTPGTIAVEPSSGTAPDGTKVSKAVNNCPTPGSSVAAGSPAETILELAKANGKKVGAITTTELTHATPAATFAHVCNRNAQYEIARQVIPGGAGYNPKLLDGVDVLMGGGRNHFTPYNATDNKKGRIDGRNLLDELKAKNYTVGATKAEMDAAPLNKKYIGLYSATSHLEYDLDRPRTAPNQPSLAEMTAKSIDLLQAQDTAGKGFFLMVEGGRIDHALHGTNAKRALQDTIAFDNAIKTALDKIKKTDPELKNTLIVVTADHDHTMTFNGYTARTGKTTATNPGILGLSYSYQEAKASDTRSRVLEDGKKHAPNFDAKGKTSTTLVFGNGGGPRPTSRIDITDNEAAADDYLQEVGVKLGSPGSETHGGGDVLLFAEGAGSQVFKGTRENAWVFSKLKEAFGFK
ncbi:MULTISPECIES: alkaline phosphatase [Acinetobacter]|uniref:alkaline phosphatase n=1 Tax=Acinetobacter TaxID=469 RepID=UPI002580BC86|nr:alkaline phosphatase [Acinetobacter sp. UBA2063]